MASSLLARDSWEYSMRLRRLAKSLSLKSWNSRLVRNSASMGVLRMNCLPRARIERAATAETSQAPKVFVFGAESCAIKAGETGANRESRGISELRFEISE